MLASKNVGMPREVPREDAQDLLAVPRQDPHVEDRITEVPGDIASQPKRQRPGGDERRHPIRGERMRRAARQAIDASGQRGPKSQRDPSRRFDDGDEREEGPRREEQAHLRKRVSACDGGPCGENHDKRETGAGVPDEKARVVASHGLGRRILPLARAGEVVACERADVGEDRRELRWIGQEDDAERALFRGHAEARPVHAQDAGRAQ